MMNVKSLCRDALTREKLLLTVLGGAAVATLSAVNVRTALFVSAAVIVMLTLATAVSTPLYKVTGKQGVEAVYFALCAVAAMSFAVLATHLDVINGDGIAKIMVLTVAGSLVAGKVPRGDVPTVSSIIDSSLTGIVFALVAVVTAAVRELLAYGTFMDRPVINLSLPIAADPAFGLMLLGIIAVLINEVHLVIRTVRMKMNERGKEVSVSDE